ncbi:hypothetical protein A9B99_03525 [Mangrovibacter phragmitis]|uniref:Uncharacterized protein n=1 Tax=Mangrovibacter phragmitis TaxID=1691903 RepID=A0A1B7L913_9ENTR|nr:hypothetical protein A9B99_03525 [Mangrovibacter phragmitis]
MRLFPFTWTDVKVPFTSSDVVNVASQPVNVLRGPPLNNPVFRGQPVLRTAFTSGQSACGRLDSASCLVSPYSAVRAE